jgi:hypothetical protein
MSRSSSIPIDASTNPRHNRLLAALPHDQWCRWLPHLEHVEMPLGEVLYEAGGTLSHVYFPTTAIVSLLYVMHDGASAERVPTHSSCNSSGTANRPTICTA